MKEKLSGTTNYDGILSKHNGTISSAKYRRPAEKSAQLMQSANLLLSQWGY
jgi:hypothetical protein